MFNLDAELSGSPITATGSVVVADSQRLRVFPFGKSGSYFIEFRFLQDPSGVVAVRNFNEDPGHVIEVHNYIAESPITLGRRLISAQPQAQ